MSEPQFYWHNVYDRRDVCSYAPKHLASWEIPVNSRVLNNPQAIKQMFENGVIEPGTDVSERDQTKSLKYYTENKDRIKDVHIGCEGAGLWINGYKTHTCFIVFNDKN